ncbi:MAG: hypothetical protein ACE5NC_09905, partial [Anaerolineae bacterium]
MKCWRVKASWRSGSRSAASARARLATGRRVNRPSDDPEAAGAGTRLQSRFEALGQYNRQADAALSQLGGYDSLLAQLNEIAASAQELTLRGSSSVGAPAAALAGLPAPVERPDR